MSNSIIRYETTVGAMKDLSVMVLKSVLYHLFSMFFHPFYGLSFHSLNSVFWKTGVMKSKLLCSSFMSCTLIYVSEKLLPNLRPQAFSPVLSSRGFIVALSFQILL